MYVDKLKGICFLIVVSFLLFEVLLDQALIQVSVPFEDIVCPCYFQEEETF